MTDLRFLPDVELLVLAVLTDVQGSTSTPDSLGSLVPWRVVYKLGGVAVDPRFLDKPHVKVVSYGSTRQLAKALAETARVKLFNAGQSQFRATNLGHISRVTEVFSPFEVRTGTEPDGVFRFDGTYQVSTRP
jgi:hypothetical protein